MWRAARVATMVTVGLLATPVPSGAKEERPPNILLVTLDTVRADHLSVYGYRFRTDPELRKLASESVVFEDATAVAPLTLPSHLSLLTGVYPLAHGVHDNDQVWKGGGNLAELLRDRGYQTAAFVSAFVLSSRFGLSRGFDEYDDYFTEASKSEDVTIERPAQATVDAALRWLGKRTPDKPFLLWVHLFEPHRPYQPPAPFKTAFDSLYDGEIATADAAAGRLFAALRADGSWSETVAVVASDHGEGLGEHEEGTHGYFVYQSTLRVPLIVKMPHDRLAGARVVRPVSLVDVAPTLARLAGAAPPPGMQGRRLAELMEVEPAPEDSSRGLYAESYTFQLHFDWAGLRVYRRGRLKLIDSAVPELYDLSRDPTERENLFRQQQSLASGLQSELERLVRQYTGATGPSPGESPDPVTVQKLRSLGYSALSLPNRTALDRSLPDAKTKLGVFKRFREAERLLQSRPREAIQILKEIIRLEPRMLRAKELLSVALADSMQWNEAVEELVSLERLIPQSYKPPAQLSVAYERLGKPDLALAALDRALLLDPKNPYLHFNRGHLLERAGRAEEALESYQRATQIQPSYPEAHFNMGQLLFRGRNIEEALRHYSAAAAANPRWREALNNAGLCLALLGRLEEAAATWRKALSVDPDYQAARSNLVKVLEDLGRDEEAERERKLLPKAKPN